jgi:hypothetical protein
MSDDRARHVSVPAPGETTVLVRRTPLMIGLGCIALVLLALIGLSVVAVREHGRVSNQSAQLRAAHDVLCDNQQAAVSGQELDAEAIKRIARLCGARAARGQQGATGCHWCDRQAGRVGAGAARGRRGSRCCRAQRHERRFGAAWLHRRAGRAGTARAARTAWATRRAGTAGVAGSGRAGRAGAPARDRPPPGPDQPAVRVAGAQEGLRIGRRA